MLVRGALIAALICLSACDRVLLRGTFHSVAHKGSGKAVVTKGRLRLIDLKTYPAADLQVCIIAAPDAEDNEIVLRSVPVCLGPSVRTTFDLPKNLDLAHYRAVVIWSPTYNVNFTTAPLE
jgi:hypothetical protein